MQYNFFDEAMANYAFDGQYVLTAVKDNGNVSYVWVKMDLTTEERIQ